MIYDIFLYKERRAFMNLDIYSHNLTINYSDVDENNQVTNKGLLRLLQEVAGIHCGLLGYGVNDTPKTGLAWILLNWKLKVFARPKTNTNLLIRKLLYLYIEILKFMITLIILLQLQVLNGFYLM